MPHRSNQAVASQAEDGSAGPEGPQPRQPRFGWPAVLGAAGIGVVVLAAGLWFLRMPLATGLIRAELNHRGVDSHFRIVNLDFGSVALAAVRLGPEDAPDVYIGGAEAAWSWNGLTPALRAIHLSEPRLRLRVDPAGRLSFGALDHLAQAGAPAGGARPSLPRFRLDIEDGQLLIDAPFGALTGQFRATGTLGRDFSALAQIGEATRPGEAYGMDAGRAELVVRSRQDTLSLRLTGQARSFTWAQTRISAVDVSAMANAPLDLSHLEAQALWRATSVRAPGDLALDHFSGRVGGDMAMRENTLAPAAWTGDLDTRVARIAFGEQSLDHAEINGHAEGDGVQGRGVWSMTSQRLAAFGLISDRPSAEGQLTLDLTGDEHLNAATRVAFARSRLSPDAQQRLDEAFPNLDGAPIGPTFAQAERALGAFADRFDLTASANFSISEAGARLSIAEPIEAHAANGTVARITPARNDAPAIVLQWPGPSLGGGVAIDLGGGGAPDLSLLMDSITWSEGAPFEAEGTITIESWRSGGASIGANDLALRFSAAPDGAGRLDLVGPTHITGPLGDGQVSDLVADLDLAITWGDGWRVTPNAGCLPVRLSGLDVAGLSFNAGALRLCPTAGGALIAANTNDRLSGGFLIEGLRLNGRMAGPEAQPARVGASRVAGAFSGTPDNTLLAIVASAPSVAVDMEPERTIAFQGSRLTADARITGGAWRVDGAFDAGTLEDPTLPGAVSAIAGRWNAAPEDGGVVIRVEAGEAFIVAHEAPPGAADPRPLFNPLRMTDVAAELRAGQIQALGHIALDSDGHVLANFTAEHDTAAGTGAAHVRADELVFDSTLQPYEISELARGLVENVRGPASAAADIVWTPQALTATGAVRPNGVSLAMATIPIVNDVRGEIYFSDLFTLTTPPSQHLTVGELNPGVPVRNGDLRFQLLPEQRVAIEQARFDFAGGVLAVAPTEITLGAEETRFNLTLADVDVAELITQLNAPDLAATGRVEGSFPILLTPRTAFIENGRLHASEGGGTISYVGAAGENVTGPARMAFDALRSFRYDALQLRLSGDISGEVVTEITFRGENTGQPVDLAPVASTPGFGQIMRVQNVPFAFNVRLTAPFRALARTASSIVNPTDALDAALEEQQTNPDSDVNDDGTETSVDVQVAPLR